MTDTRDKTSGSSAVTPQLARERDSSWLFVLPALFAGIFIGRKVIRIIPQKGFEILLYLFSGIAGIRLLFF